MFKKDMIGGFISGLSKPNPNFYSGSYSSQGKGGMMGYHKPMSRGRKNMPRKKSNWAGFNPGNQTSSFGY